MTHKANKHQLTMSQESKAGLFPKAYVRDLLPSEEHFLTSLAKPGVLSVPKDSIVTSPTYERIADVLKKGEICLLCC